MTLAQFIQRNSQTPVEMEAEKPTLHTIELFSRDSDIFNALYAKIKQAFPFVITLEASAQEDALVCNNAGLALFCSADENVLHSLQMFGESVMKNATAEFLDCLPTSNTLQAAMLAKHCGNTYINRKKPVISSLEAMLSSRVQSINEQHLYEVAQNARKEKTEAALAQEDCTLSREINYMVDAISATHDGVSRGTLHSLICAAADHTKTVYRDNQILEAHAAQQESEALATIIDHYTVPAGDPHKAELRNAQFKGALWGAGDHDAAINHHWTLSQKTLARSFMASMPNLERTGLKHAIGEYDISRRNNIEPITFAGINIERTQAPLFHTQLSLARMVHDNVERGQSPIDTLSGAIMTQIGAFIKMKKTALLKAEYRSFAEHLVDQPCVYTVNAQGAVMDIRARVINTML